MTNREFLNAIINGEITEDVQTFAAAQIEKLDSKNESRKSKPSKAKAENTEIANTLEIVTDEIYTAERVAKTLDITPSKATNILKILVEQEKVIEVDEMVKNSKNRKVKGYKGI